MPKLPSISIAKILLGIFLFVLALVVGLAVGTIAFRIINPDKQINIGPIQAGPSPSPIPSPIIVPSPLPSPSPTANPIPSDWETYTNEILGFTFQYPPGVTLEESDIRGENIEDAFISEAEFNYGVTIKLTDLEFVIFASSVNVLEENLPVDPQRRASDLLASSESDLTVSEVDFAQGTAYRVDTQDSPILLYFIFSYGKDEVSEISISVTADSTSAQVIDQMIGSFQFLN
jgi:hypothetical protein